ncbi:MAG: hypothetical protein HWE13_06040 [Gammaproteobacteria bacterium]|nr:hypothetical protein [Gammaproteobacteria bacterium]
MIQLLTIFTLFISTSIMAADSLPLHPELEPFRDFIGKTYRGEFANSTAEKPVIDIAKWERHLNGNAIRVTHSINNGEYGGESIIFFDQKKGQLSGYYFTTAGFFTVAEITLEAGKMISRELVTGNENNITEVRATATLNDDGSMTTKAEYLQNGKWVPGHSAVYHPSTTAKVIFK